MQPPTRTGLLGIAYRHAPILALLGVCAATFPFPIFGPSVDQAIARKESVSPYPCQHSACGCRTAEQCWKGCCCHTPEERKAWAKRHGVKPPSDAVLESKQDDPPVRACCEAKSKQTAPSSASSREGSALPRGLVIGTRFLHCHGQSSDLASLVWATVETPDSPWQLYLTVQRFVPHENALFSMVGLAVDEPPPKTSRHG